VRFYEEMAREIRAASRAFHEHADNCISAIDVRDDCKECYQLRAKIYRLQRESEEGPDYKEMQP